MNIHARRIDFPALGFGTWQLQGEQAQRSVDLALGVGYRHIDTAQAYENEAEVGAALAASSVPREQVFLTTKVIMSNFGKDRFGQSVEESLRKLKVDAVDLLLLHWPSADHDMEETLDLLLEQKMRNRTRSIGVSNYPPRMLERALRYAEGELLVNQVEYHPLLEQKELLKVIRDNDMALTAYSPLARGKALQDPKVQEIAQKHNAEPSQVVLKWLLDQPQVSVIPKASSKEHAEANFRSQELQLDASDRATLDALGTPQGRQIDPPFAPDWND